MATCPMYPSRRPYEVKEWWKQIGSPEDCIGVYNNGRHLFLDIQARPGEVIYQQMLWWRFSFPVPIPVASTLHLLHLGHTEGLRGGNALIVAISNYYRTISIEIPPFHLAYVAEAVGSRGKVQALVFPRPLPRYLCPLF